MQSIQNWVGSISRHWLTSVSRLGLAWMKEMLYSTSACLVVAREGQVSKRDSTVPGWESVVLQQSGSVHIPSLFPGVQCPVSFSILYLPERILAWVVAFSTSQGDEPHSLKIGWHLVKPINLVFIYCREMRESAYDLSMSSQYCRTAVLVMDLTCSFVG